MKDKTFYISIGIAALFLIGGMAWGGALGSGTARSFFKPSPRLAVVDMQALIAKRSQHLAKTGTNMALGKGLAKVSDHQIREAGEQLKETLEAFAAKHHLILLAKGAVMGGNLPDYTAEIMEDAFPDHTPRLLAFIESEIATQQSKSRQSEDFRLEGLQHKGQGPEDQRPESQRPEGQENQP